MPATHGEKWVIAPLYQRFAAVEDPISIIGYPITGMSLDGDGHDVQAFERAIMRHIPGSWPEKGDVQLDLIGRMVAQIKGYVNKECLPAHPAFHHAAPIPGQRFFEETGHNLGGGFRGFWERYGGLDLFGYPLSEEIIEEVRTVQYFERARFEWHPGVLPERFDVLLGLLGVEVLAAFGSIA